MLKRMVKEAHHHNNSHTPVLLESVLKYLEPRHDQSYLDLTAGYGGHASKILSMVGEASKLTLIDRDANAIASLKQSGLKAGRIIHKDFASAAEDLAAVGEQFDMILADLGVSSPHFDNAERGFSFRSDGPLDMRMDSRQPVTAASLINQANEAELTKIIREYGEEPRAGRVAKTIINARPLQTTAELAQIVEDTLGRKGKIHPATRTFQAIRIAVNDELGQVERLLKVLPKLLKPGGRAAIISFHSLEDRLVKQFLADQTASGYEAELQVLTKKPVIATEDEIVFNPRARSAKLRAVVKK